jgi:nucleotide-binding universal stress UspA family protein
MLSINKILLPVDYPGTSLGVIRQAARVAEQFHSEIVLLHVLTTRSRAAGVPEQGSALAQWDLLNEITKGAAEGHERSIARALGNLTVYRVLARGGVADVIVRTAHKERIDLVMMPSRGHTFCQFLLGSVTARVLCESQCPVWTDAYAEELPSQELAIRSILCAVDLTQHDRKTVSWAAQLAAEFGAQLTLAHVTPSIESWGPGGGYVHSRQKDALVGDASRRIAELQKAMNITADVIVGSGDLSLTLCQAAKQVNADLLVTGCHPYGGRLRTHGYGTICAMPIPVLSV